MLQSTGIELSEIRVPLLEFVNGDDIGMVKVLDSNKTTADKAPLIYLSSLWFQMVWNVMKRRTWCDLCVGVGWLHDDHVCQEIANAW